MALQFTEATHDNVNHGSAAALDTMPQGTFMLWIYLDSLASTFSTLISKSAARFLGDGPVLYIPGADTQTFQITVYRATASQDARSTQILSASAWHYIIGTWDIPNGGPKTYHGTLSSIASDVSDGVTGGDGSGAQISDSSNSLTSGDNEYPSSNGWYAPPGRIALVAVFNTDLSLAQVRQQQFQLWSPVAPSSCQIFAHYGFNGTGTQPDWSGNQNNGTQTGTTQAAHVPLPIFPYRIWMPQIPAAVDEKAPAFLRPHRSIQIPIHQLQL